MAWIEKTPKPGDVVRFYWSDFMKQESPEIGIFLRTAPGSATTFYVIDIGRRRLFLDYLTTFEVYEN